MTYEHPEDALYVFGPENCDPPNPLRPRCHRFVFLPTHHCLNLAAAVNVVRYERGLKRQLEGREQPGPLRELLLEHRGPVAGLVENA